MKTMVRLSTRQLARLTARSLGRATTTTAGPPPSASAAIALHLRRRRAYSTQKPTPPNPPPPPPPPEKKKAGEDKAAENKAKKAKGDDGLPPGWVRLTDEEMQRVEALINLLPANRNEAMKRVVSDLEKHGAPAELRDLIAKQMRDGLGIADSMKAVRIAMKLAETSAQREAEQTYGASKPQTPPFDQNPPPSQEQNKQADKNNTKGQGQNQERRQEQDPGQQGDKKDQPPRLSFGINITSSNLLTWTLGSLAVSLFFQWLSPGDGGAREITWQELRRNYLEKGLVDKIVVMGNRARVELNREATRSVYPDSSAHRSTFTLYVSIGSVDGFERRLDDAQEELGIPPADRIPVQYAGESPLAQILLNFGPTLLLVSFLLWGTRRAVGGSGRNSPFNFGQSKAKMFNHETSVKVKFADVAGMEEAKVEIMEFVSFLRTPERFQRLGAKIPRGAILSGPPGTGKTLLAKATAGESQVPFFSVSGSEFVEMFVGVGASRVRDLFQKARKHAPCIIFIDEIDAIGKARSESGGRFGGNDEREATLNQILTEMDGFNTSEQVIVLAGTNRPDTLDKALMRPGRFDRQIHIEKPTTKGRKDIFAVHLQKIRTNEDADFLTGRLAALTPGFAGADIANAVNEAALIGRWSGPLRWHAAPPPSVTHTGD